MPQQDQTVLKDRVRALAEESASARGLFIVDVQLRGQPGSRVVEVFADSDDGVGLDELAELSREIGFVLETEDIIKGRYHLNVSSPGADRSLTHPRQFRAQLGRALRVHLGEGDEQQALAGTLVSVDDEGIDLDIDGGERARVRFDQMRDARVELPW